MKFFILLIVLIKLAASQLLGGEVCYAGYGCFTNKSPFQDLRNRPIALLPESPTKIGVRFNLFTRKNPTTATVITSQNPTATFIPNRQTRFVVHGFLDNSNKPWMLEMRNALLQAEDTNIILVDWSKGNQLPYTQATANTQIVGAEIANLVNAYIGKGLITLNDVHIIGHSLGSHIAGYAGERIPGKIARITGLDPAGPYFENTDPKVRLDPTDAKFVEAIHTDGTPKIGLGLLQKVGHVDFYPNGGKDQPGCSPVSPSLLTAFTSPASTKPPEEMAACSHYASVHFYKNSIKKGDCTYTAYPCASLADLKAGKCNTCGAKGCNRMGHYTMPTLDTGNLYLATQDAPKICQPF